MKSCQCEKNRGVRQNHHLLVLSLQMWSSGWTRRGEPRCSSVITFRRKFLIWSSGITAICSSRWVIGVLRLWLIREWRRERVTTRQWRISLVKFFFFKFFLSQFNFSFIFFHLLLLLLLLFHYHLLLSLSSPSSPLLLAFSLFFFSPFLFFPCFLVTWGDSPPLDTPETAAEVEILSFQRCLVDPEQGLPRLSLLSLGFLLISPVSPLGCYLLSGIVPGACAAGHTRLLLGYCS